MVQRVLSAKDKLHARAGTVLAGYLKILPMFLMVLPGMVSRVLYPRRVGCADRCACKAICDNSEGCSNIAYPELVIRLLPSGATGLLLAVMMAALMSSLASTFNSAGTMFTMDVWKALRPRSSQREQVYVGYAVVASLVVVSIAWLPILQAFQGAQLFIYIQAISNYIQPPFTVIFLTGIFWTRTTLRGAFAGLFTGLSIGVTRLLLELVYNLALNESPKKCETDTRPWVVTVLYLYVGMFSFFTSLAVTVIVSLFTKPIPADRLAGITWPTRNQAVLNVSERYADESKPFVRQAVPRGEEETEFMKQSQRPSSSTDTTSEAEGSSMVHDERDDLDETNTMECIGRVLSPTATRWTLRISVLCLLLILIAVWLVLR